MKYSTVLIVVFILVFSASCVQVNSEAKTQIKNSQGSAGLSGAVSVGRILSNGSTYLNTPVFLTATFMGWKGKCKGAPPVSRSDWMVDDGTGCIYVTGKLPMGQNAMTPKEVVISIRGVVKRGQNGTVYIESF
jgi:hypothetical protein